jgi:fatty acid desaturase
MLNEYERRTLGEVEREIAAADPMFAAMMRDAQQRLERPAVRPHRDAVIALLVLLAVGLLLLGSLSALVVAALAGALWGLRGYRIVDHDS